MARCRLIAALLVVASATAASAQTTANTLTGFATVHLGIAAAGDIRDRGWVPGVSLAVIEASGLGAEVDLSHVRQFDNARFLESGISSLMINAIGLWGNPDRVVRPYGVGGIGLLRARACVSECQLAVSRTEVGMDLGAGAFVVFSDLIAVRGDVRYFRYLQRHADLPLTDNGFFDFWRTSLGIALTWPIR